MRKTSELAPLDYRRAHLHQCVWLVLTLLHFFWRTPFTPYINSLTAFICNKKSSGRVVGVRQTATSGHYFQQVAVQPGFDSGFGLFTRIIIERVKSGVWGTVRPHTRVTIPPTGMAVQLDSQSVYGRLADNFFFANFFLLCHVDGRVEDALGQKGNRKSEPRALENTLR